MLFLFFLSCLWLAQSKDCYSTHAVSFKEGVKSGLVSAPQEEDKCRCQMECTSEEVVIVSQKCTTIRDQCEPCDVRTSTCAPRNCTLDNTTQALSSAQEDCTSLSVTSCNCCVQPPGFWLAQCETGPDFNSTSCGPLCAMCMSVCDNPICNWLGGNPFSSSCVYDERQILAIQMFIEIWLDKTYPSPCIPSDVQKIWFDMSMQILLQDNCCGVALTDAQLVVLFNFLNGNSTQAPLCPAQPGFHQAEPKHRIALGSEGKEQFSPEELKKFLDLPQRRS